MSFIKVFVQGIPKAQPRPRATRRGNHVGIYNPSSADGWKLQVKAAFLKYNGLMIGGPIRCDIVFLMPRPKRLMRKADPEGRIPHSSKPDRDNLDKSVLDCLSGQDKNGKGGIGVWKDDCQVFDGQIEKYYHAKSGEPGAWVTISYGENV